MTDEDLQPFVAANCGPPTQLAQPVRLCCLNGAEELFPALRPRISHGCWHGMADEFLPEGEPNVMRPATDRKAWRAFLARVRVFTAED
jgi:hypothetical protein